MAAVQPKQDLAAFTQLNHRRLTNDLKAIPAEKQNVSPGGCAHSPLHMVAECAMVNGYVADFLTGGEVSRMPSEQREAHLSSFDTQEKALAYLDQETARVLAAIEALDESTLGDVSDKLAGRPMSRYAVAQMSGAHMMYHDGQLTLIQSLYGDAGSHW
jgi:uncharacterized damage-inducible protein DinB